MKIEGDNITFSTGREFQANRGIIGISPKGNVTEGYDGGFWHDEMEEDGEDEIDILTIDERIELADHMINQWQKFMETAEKERP